MTNFISVFARLIPLILVIGLAGCATSNQDADLNGATLAPADVLYAKAVSQVQQGKYDEAIKRFDAIEENYPYSTWATHAQLLHGYAQYKQQNYDDAISALDRFIALHPENQDIAYAYYLKSLCYYEQIDDVQRDQTSTYEAIDTLTDVTVRFPDSAYARDARIKLRLAENRLAGHDMVIGRFYEKQHLYGAAVGRYQDVITSYQTTTYVPEALERLTETYLDLGLTDAAQRTASVLAYNYPGSTWYAAAYGKLEDHGLVADAETPAPPRRGFFFGLF
jgi:outer membrane protein assembly factor BamD